MGNLTFQAGISALLLATAVLLVFLVQYPVLPLSGCTEVGYTGEVPGGLELYALDGSDLVYTPDGGVNECSTHVAVPGIPVGLLALGTLLVGVSLLRR